MKHIKYIAAITTLFASIAMFAMKEVDQQTKFALENAVIKEYTNKDCKLVPDDNKEKLKVLDPSDALSVATWVRNTMPWDIPHKMELVGAIRTPEETGVPFYPYPIIYSKKNRLAAIPATHGNDKTCICVREFGSEDPHHLLHGPANTRNYPVNKIAFAENSQQVFGLYRKRGYPLKTIIAAYDLSRKGTRSNGEGTMDNFIQHQLCYTIDVGLGSRQQGLAASGDGASIGVLDLSYCNSTYPTIFKVFTANKSGKVLHTKALEPGQLGNSYNIECKNNIYTVSFRIEENTYVTYTYNVQTKKETTETSSQPGLPLVNGDTNTPTWTIGNNKITTGYLRYDPFHLTCVNTNNGHKKQVPLFSNTYNPSDELKPTLASPYIWAAPTQRSIYPGFSIFSISSGTDKAVIISALQRVYNQQNNVVKLRELAQHCSKLNLLEKKNQRDYIRKNIIRLLTNQCMQQITSGKELSDKTIIQPHMLFAAINELTKDVTERKFLYTSVPQKIAEQLASYLKEQD